MIGNRIKEARVSIKLATSEAAKMFDMTQGNYSKIERGSQRPSYYMLSQICELWNVSPTWLILGKGDMFNSPSFVTNTLDNSPVLAWYNSMSDKEKTWFEIELMRKFPEFKDFVDKRKI